MRVVILLLSLVAVGCVANTKKAIPSATETKQELPDPPTVTKAMPSKVDQPPVVTTDPKRWQPKPNEADPAVAPPPADVVPDLRTRKTGSDWESFLGPAGTSVSSEKGIIAPWPKEGLRVVWTEKIGNGYVMPTISKGRLFLFDHAGDKNRLRCLKSETGEFLWKFEYQTDYEDIVGFGPGPRCSPIVDGGRVYIYGPEGVLHCLAVADGKLIW